MLTELETERYDRHLKLKNFGKEAQGKLKASRVLVIGAGGLGSPVLYYLSASGVGTIGIIDFDTVSVSNLQRQILYDTSMAGRPKVEMASERLTALNPLIRVNTYNEKLTTSNALQIFSQYDIIVDGTDNFPSRYLINDACNLLKKPLVYGSVFRFQGQVSVFNLERNGERGPTYRCLFPEPPAPEHSPDCSDEGVLGVLPGTIGCIQATETIKIICNIGKPLSGKILIIDTLDNSYDKFELSRNEDAVSSGPTNEAEFLNFDYSWFCNTAGEGTDISAEGFLKLIKTREEIQVVDVREPLEKPEISFINTIKIPLGKIRENLHALDGNKKTILLCKGGTRSRKAFHILKETGKFNQLYNLRGGVDEMSGKPDIYL